MMSSFQTPANSSLTYPRIMLHYIYSAKTVDSIVKQNPKMRPTNVLKICWQCLRNTSMSKFMISELRKQSQWLSYGLDDPGFVPRKRTVTVINFKIFRLSLEPTRAPIQETWGFCPFGKVEWSVKQPQCATTHICSSLAWTRKNF